MLLKKNFFFKLFTFCKGLTSQGLLKGGGLGGSSEGWCTGGVIFMKDSHSDPGVIA